MIISASRRTDIPAFYSDWFINRVKEGFVYVRNPMNPKQVSKVNLSSDLIDCIVFWTKDPYQMINNLDSLNDYMYYFQYTLNAYPINIETNLPPLEKRLETFIELSEKIGNERVIWRYDPVLLTDDIDIEFHMDKFSYIATKLKDYTKTVVISIVDDYRKINNSMKSISYRKIDNQELEEVMTFFKKIADKYNLDIQSCSEELDVAKFGIKPGKCIDDDLISKLIGDQIYFKKDKNQREICGCVESVDIGAYNTCSHQCKYCYANFSQSVVKDNVKKHDKKSPFIIGNSMESDKVTERKIVKGKKKIDQMTFL